MITAFRGNERPGGEGRGGRTLQGCSACLNIHKSRGNNVKHTAKVKISSRQSIRHLHVFHLLFVFTDCIVRSTDLVPATFAADFRGIFFFLFDKMKR